MKRDGDKAGQRCSKDRVVSFTLHSHSIGLDIGKLLNYFKLINIDAKKYFEKVCFCPNILNSKNNRIVLVMLVVHIVFSHVSSISQSFDRPRRLITPLDKYIYL